MKTLSDYQQELPHYRSFLDLLERIRRLRPQPAAAAGAIITPTPEEARERLAAGCSLAAWERGQEPLDLSPARAYFSRLLDLAAEFDAATSTALQRELQEHPEIYAGWVRELFPPEKLYSESRPESLPENFESAPAGDAAAEARIDLTLWLLAESLKPFFTQLAADHEALLRRTIWNHGHCPVCSRPASLGLIRGDGGRRSLFCLLCDHEWAYPRLQCPFCGNQEQEQLSYFTVDDDDARRVHICRQCRRYLKTFDARKLGEELDPELEDLVSMHLDLKASHEGYS